MERWQKNIKERANELNILYSDISFWNDGEEEKIKEAFTKICEPILSLEDVTLNNVGTKNQKQLILKVFDNTYKLKINSDSIYIEYRTNCNQGEGFILSCTEKGQIKEYRYSNEKDFKRVEKLPLDYEKILNNLMNMVLEKIKEF